MAFAFITNVVKAWLHEFGLKLVCDTQSELFMTMVARFGEKGPIGLFLAAVGTLKFGFGALLLFKPLAATWTT